MHNFILVVSAKCPYDKTWILVTFNYFPLQIPFFMWCKLLNTLYTVLYYIFEVCMMIPRWFFWNMISLSHNKIIWIKIVKQKKQKNISFLSISRTDHNYIIFIIHIILHGFFSGNSHRIFIIPRWDQTNRRWVAQYCQTLRKNQKNILVKKPKALDIFFLSIVRSYDDIFKGGFFSESSIHF